MSESNWSMPAIAASPRSAVPLVRRSAVALHTCLIVSSSPHRAQRWVRAAQEEDWETVVCTTADDANRQSIRNRIDLALIDLQSVGADKECVLKEFIERLSGRQGLLLAVCGKPEDPTGELWSRQLGVWMYLPGVDRESDMALLCGEARRIVNKLGNQPVRSPDG